MVLRELGSRSVVEHGQLDNCPVRGLRTGSPRKKASCRELDCKLLLF